MSSPFVTVRYPDGAWEVTDWEKVPNSGQTLRRSSGKWTVTATVVDTSGHVIVAWRREAKRVEREALGHVADKPPPSGPLELW